MKKTQLVIEKNLDRKIIILLGIFIIFLARNVSANNPIIINEIMYDLEGADPGYEWIEIKNISSEPVDLTNWKFNDGSSSNHILNSPPKNGGQGSLIIPSGGFAIFADKADLFLSTHPNFSGIVIDTTMSLTNTEGTLKLIDNNGNVVEEVYYNKAMGGNGNGFSLERVSENSSKFCESKNEGGSPGQENNFDCNKILSSSFPTPIKTIAPTFSPLPDDNSVSSENNLLANLENSNLTPKPTPIKVNLIINEFLPNPTGPDNEGEWIELYNNSDADVDLTNWRLEDASGQKYVFKNEVIKKKDFLVLSYNKTKISLNNNGETLTLYSPQNEIAFKITYSGNAKEGYSFARFAANDWRWTKILTPGAPNQFSSDNDTKNSSKINVDSQIENGQNNGENANVQKQESTSVSLASSTSDNLLTPQTNKIIIIAIGIGVILSIASAIFIKKVLP